MVGLSFIVSEIASNPLLFFAVVLILGILVVNGATSAVNTFAVPVGTHAIRAHRAINLAVPCYFVGLIGLSMVSSATADSMRNMVDFGDDGHSALVALAAAAAAIVVWASLAWYFGIPTSQTHALVAGLCGAALAFTGDFSSVDVAQLGKVIFGLVISSVGGFFSGWAITKAISVLCQNMDRRRMNRVFRRMQVVAASGGAAMHGGQDGQRFAAMGMMAVAFSAGMSPESLGLPLSVKLVCAGAIALGSMAGGRRIIKSVGMEMAELEHFQGFAAVTASTLLLLLAILTGLPMATANTFSSSIMGAGAAKDFRDVDWSVARKLLLTWICTFPGAGIMGFFMTKLFLRLF